MDNSIEIRINSYDKNEIKKALSFYILKVREMNVYFWIVYTVISMAVVLSLIFSQHAPLSIIFLACGFTFHFFYYIRPINWYKEYYEKAKNIVCKFNRDCLEMANETTRSTSSWKAFKKAFEIPSAFLLLDENKFIYVFLKCHFANSSEIEKIRALLSENILHFKVYK